MNPKNFEQFFTFHCAPTLVGIKAANLITIPKERFRNFSLLLKKCEPCLCCRGISFFTLSDTSRFKALLLYRQDVIAALLQDEAVQELLAPLGYRPQDTVEEQLAYLRIRMQIRKSFPHEIGIFLGYPFEDVKGFMKHGGKNYKMNGYWKVYENPDAAKRLFSQYAECSHSLCESLARGATLQNLLVAI